MENLAGILVTPQAIRAREKHRIGCIHETAKKAEDQASKNKEDVKKMFEVMVSQSEQTMRPGHTVLLQKYVVRRVNINLFLLWGGLMYVRSFELVPTGTHLSSLRSSEPPSERPGGGGGGDGGVVPLSTA